MEHEMQIYGAGVRALREKKSWSQEHLASASGLSVRTIQRVEVENIASAETRLALAAALDVPVIVLIPPQSSSAVSDSPEVPSARAAAHSLMEKIAFGIFVTFALLAGLLVLFNALSGFLPRQAP
jgi:transcriptional regulator with XRE-family HTH domain